MKIVHWFQCTFSNTCKLANLHIACSFVILRALHAVVYDLFIDKDWQGVVDCSCLVVHACLGHCPGMRKICVFWP
jgi:hypothetical protein